MVRNLIGFVILALLLGACVRTYNTEVTSFHELTQPSGETFIIAARNKKASVELKSYAGVISDYLKAEGFVAAGEAKPDFTVTIDYDISEPALEGDRFRGAYYGEFLYNARWYGLGLWNGYNYTYPALARRSLNFDADAFPVYGHAFEMVIETKTKRILYEGTATSIGREKELDKFLPVLIKALFAEFPGESGTTQHVKVKLTEENGT